MSQLDYLFMAAHASRLCAKQWFRYLRKFVSADGIPKISRSDVCNALRSTKLTMFQKVTLDSTMTYGTPTYAYIRKLNQPCKKNMVMEAIRRIRNE